MNNSIIERSGFSKELLEEWSNNADEGESCVSTRIHLLTISGFNFQR
jgi:hypothetical protein